MKQFHLSGRLEEKSKHLYTHYGVPQTASDFCERRFCLHSENIFRIKKNKLKVLLLLLLLLMVVLLLLLLLMVVVVLVVVVVVMVMAMVMVMVIMMITCRAIQEENP